jgi:hypothetical protein
LNSTSIGSGIATFYVVGYATPFINLTNTSTYGATEMLSATTDAGTSTAIHWFRNLGGNNTAWNAGAADFFGTTALCYGPSTDGVTHATTSSQLCMDSAGVHLPQLATNTNPLCASGGLHAAITNVNCSAGLIPISTPTSSSATCTAGQHTADSSYLYICVATNSWRRVTEATF